MLARDSAAATGRPLLVAERLACVAEAGPLFADLHLEVHPGDLVEVRGPNGSGKSTLLRCLAGLIAPESGHVRRRCDIDYVGHRSAVCGRLTALENLRWLARVRGEDASRTDAAAALRGMGLAGSVYGFCDAMSAGQVRRVALARLPLGTAEIWLLDEPLAALDDDGARRLGSLIAAHRAGGGAAVCSTHRPICAGNGREAADLDDASLAPTRTLRLGA